MLFGALTGKQSIMPMWTQQGTWWQTALLLNTLRLRQNGRNFPDDIFKWSSLNENVWILIQISYRYVPVGPINNIPALVQIMAWRRLGDKPLSEPVMVSLLMHICSTRPQWVNVNWISMTPYPGYSQFLAISCPAYKMLKVFKYIAYISFIITHQWDKIIISVAHYVAGWIPDHNIPWVAPSGGWSIAFVTKEYSRFRGLNISFLAHMVGGCFLLCDIESHTWPGSSLYVLSNDYECWYKRIRCSFST